MNEFSKAQETVVPSSSVSIVGAATAGKHYAAYVGLDVHKDTIAVAVAYPGVVRNNIDNAKIHAYSLSYNGL